MNILLRFNTYWQAKDWCDAAYVELAKNNPRYRHRPSKYGLAVPFREADHEGVCRDTYWWVSVTEFLAIYIPKRMLEGSIPHRKFRGKEYATFRIVDGIPSDSAADRASTPD